MWRADWLLVQTGRGGGVLGADPIVNKPLASTATAFSPLLSTPCQAFVPTTGLFDTVLCFSLHILAIFRDTYNEINFRDHLPIFRPCLRTALIFLCRLVLASSRAVSRQAKS